MALAACRWWVAGGRLGGVGAWLSIAEAPSVIDTVDHSGMKRHPGGINSLPANFELYAIFFRHAPTTSTNFVHPSRDELSWKNAEHQQSLVHKSVWHEHDGRVAGPHRALS